MKQMIIVNPGFYTTVQDKGRTGYQEFGIPVSGAMDDYSFRIANILVGNDEYEAVLEATLTGPEIYFETDAVVSIAGANMIPRINGRIAPMWRSLKVSAGDMLSFNMAREGARSYIAVAGGMDIPAVMGSRSTYVRGAIGGISGRKLESGDRINLMDCGAGFQELVNRRVPRQCIPEYRGYYRIRAVPGPQDDCFTEDSIEKFFNSVYEVTNEMDRMGCRLSGEALTHKAGADIISDGISFGSIQIPGHGMPIVMLADRQTTGGYPKIATVISADLPLMAQLRPGDRIRFERTDIREAHRILKEYEERMRYIKDYVKDNRLSIRQAKHFKLTVDGICYEVTAEEVE